MTGKEAGSEIDTVPVSYNTTSRRVDDVTWRWRCIVWNTKTNTNFALKVDESTDITNKAHPKAFVRLENEGEIMEIFVVLKNCQKQLKVKIFSASCLLIWNPVVCHRTSVLESALMVRPEWSAQ
jgi:hypothetical protein